MTLAAPISIHQAALLRIVAALVAMLGLAEGGTLARLPRRLHRVVMRVLIPAESAVRRLIIMAATGVVVEARPVRKARKTSKRSAKKKSTASQLFQLFDIRKNFEKPSGWHRKGPKVIPRVHSFGDPHLVPLFHKPFQPTVRDDTIGAASLLRRLAAIKAALEDLPKQAERLVRWQERRAAMERPKFKDPMRVGRPPGYRKKPKHEVDYILIECHGLATGANWADTS